MSKKLNTSDPKVIALAHGMRGQADTASELRVEVMAVASTENGAVCVVATGPAADLLLKASRVVATAFNEKDLGLFNDFADALLKQAKKPTVVRK